MSNHSNDDAIAEIAEMQKKWNVRLATIIATDKGAGTMELIYVLDHDGEIWTVRSEFLQDDELASLSSVFLGAENMEREIIDLLGIKFEGIKGLFLEPGPGIMAPLRKQEQGV
jgi:NADH:ubiquinone oxidoreductase subunit C